MGAGAGAGGSNEIIYSSRVPSIRKKFAAELRSALGGGSGFAGQGGIFDDRGDFRLIPSYLSLVYSFSKIVVLID